MKKQEFYLVCPHCGAYVPTSALSCPECGSDKETGWSSSSADEEYSIHDEDEHEAVGKAGRWKSYLAPAGAAILAFVFLAAYLPLWIALGFAVLVVIGGFVFYLVRNNVRVPGSAERRLRLELLRMVGGDKEQLKRLIAHERMRSPDASILDLLDHAIYRLQRDRR